MKTIAMILAWATLLGRGAMVLVGSRGVPRSLPIEHWSFRAADLLHLLHYITVMILASAAVRWDAAPQRARRFQVHLDRAVVRALLGLIPAHAMVCVFQYGFLREGELPDMEGNMADVVWGSIFWLVPATLLGLALTPIVAPQDRP